MVKGDIVLLPFPFTDLSGNRNRPALVLASNEMDLTVAFISTQLRWKESSDVVLVPNPINGLKKESVIRLSKIATIDRKMVLGIIGKLDYKELSEVNQNLVKIFKL